MSEKNFENSRNAAEITLNKVDSYDELNALTEKEGDEKFSEKTRELEKSSQREKDFSEAEMRIEQEQVFPEQFKFDPSKERVETFKTIPSRSIWVDIKGMPGTVFDDWSSGYKLGRNDINDLIRIHELFGKEGLE